MENKHRARTIGNLCVVRAVADDGLRLTIPSSPKAGLRSFWLDLAAAMTPDVRYANEALFAQAQTGPQIRSYGYAFGHEPS